MYSKCCWIGEHKGETVTGRGSFTLLSLETLEHEKSTKKPEENNSTEARVVPEI